MRISLEETAAYLKENDNYLFLCHAHPDGDTLGSALALARALKIAGKSVFVRCSDKVGDTLKFLFDGYHDEPFTPECIVAIDVADPKLLGEGYEKKYGDKIDLCIDHHGSNLLYAKKVCLEEASASTAEMVYFLIGLLGVEITPDIASCLFTGVTTDTGCFRFANTTVRTYEIAADLAKKGADTKNIIIRCFETKTKNFAHLERLALDSMQFYLEDKCALIYITKEMFIESGTDDSYTDRLANLPRQIEGVTVGVTMRELKSGKIKVSVRTHCDVNASKICARLGGGGHPGAAGCTFTCPKEEAIAKMLEAVRSEICL